MIMYYVAESGNEISPREIRKQTKHFVWEDHEYWVGQSARKSSYGIYFNTWDEAKDYILERAEKKVESAKTELKLCLTDLYDIKGLKNPLEGGEN